MSANLQIFTLRRVFLTAQSKRPHDNENQGGKYEAQHLAQLQPDCMDGVVLCNSYGHPPYIANCVSVAVWRFMQLLCQLDKKTSALQPLYESLPYDDIEEFT